MKKSIILLFALAAFACGKKGADVSLVLENPLDAERADQSFVISRSSLTVPDGDLLPAVINEKGEFVASQVDDLDKDGTWDELAFVYTMAPKEKANLQITWVPSAEYPKFTPRTNVRAGLYNEQTKKVEPQTTLMHGKNSLERGKHRTYPYQMDGIAWENDRSGFRHYFDGRNCRDYFGKRVTDMVLDHVGIKDDGTPGDTYHVWADWGRDIMSVSASFGLGGLGLEMPDSLVRLGVMLADTTDNVDSTRFTLLANGPVRSIFTLDFYGWDVPGKKVDVKQIVTIWAGRQGYQNEVITSELPDSSHLITGIVHNFNNKEFITATTDKMRTMATHDHQSYNKEFIMGMGLIVPQDNIAGELFFTPTQGPGIIYTWCAPLKADANGRVVFYPYGGWEHGVDKTMGDRESWLKYMDSEAANLSNPVIMTIGAM